MPRKPKLAVGGVLPKPKFREVRDSDRGKNARKFFEYWAKLPAEKAELVIVNAYRMWPQVDLQTKVGDGESSGSKVWYQFSGPIQFKPEEYEDAILSHEQFGSGDYKFILNEAGVDGYVMMAYFSCMDLENHPPVVDLRTCIWGTHRMESFKQFLHRRNIPIPGEEPEVDDEAVQEAADEMEAVKGLVDVAQRTTEKNIELTERLLDRGDRENREDNNAGNSNSARALDAYAAMVQKGAETGMEILKSQATASNKSFDPIDMMRAAAEITTSMRGDGGDNGSFRGLAEVLERSNERALNIQRESHVAQMDMFRMLIDRQQPQAPAVSATPPKTLIEQIQDLKAIKEVLGEFGGGRSTVPQIAAAPAGPGILEKIAENPTLWLAGITTVFTLGANIVYNIVNKTAPVDPVAAMQRANGQPQQQVAPQQSGVPAPAPQSTGDPYTGFISRIAQPFLGHFYDAQLNGYQFAQWIQSGGTGGTVTQSGRADYMKIKEDLGPKDGADVMGCGFDIYIRQNHDIWSRVQSLPGKYRQFLEEFFAYDEWVQDQQDGVSATVGGKAA